MPTYEYECLKCGDQFERFQTISAQPLKRCPKCRGKIKRLPGTGAGIIFKGSGFYETDYRSDSYKKAEKADTSTTPVAEGKSEGTKQNKQAKAGDTAGKTPTKAPAG